MTLIKLWRTITGRIERHVSPDIAPSTKIVRYEDNDKEERKFIQKHLDEANSVLFRFKTQQTLRRREY